MKTPTPKVVPYKHSKTSNYVIEGLRVNGKRVRRFFKTRRAADAWLRKTMARVAKEGEGAVHNCGLAPDSVSDKKKDSTFRRGWLKKPKPIRKILPL